MLTADFLSRRLIPPFLVSLWILFLPGAAWTEVNAGVFSSFDRAVFDTGLENSGMVIQDRDGFLWVATHGNGLYRWDGSQVKAFTADRPGSLPDPRSRRCTRTVRGSSGSARPAAAW